MLIHNADITGSLLVNGTRFNTGSFSGSFTGIVAGTTATASYVEYNSVANKPTLVSGSSQITYSGLTGIPSGIVSGSSQVTYSGLTGIPAGIVSGSAQVTYSGLTGIPSGIVSGSAQVTYSGLTGVPSGIVSGSAQVSSFGIFATTGSNGFNGSQSITGSLTVTGQVVAQTLNVQQVTSSIVYSSGSNIFGNSISNVQQFTGSISASGSMSITPGITVTGDGSNDMFKAVRSGTTRVVIKNGVNTLGINTDTINNPLTVNGGADFSGNVGIGNTSPQGLLQIGANALSNNTDASNAFNLKQTSTTAATGIYLERSGERRGYYMYIGGSVDSLTFARNDAGTKADVMSLTRDGRVGIGTDAPGANLHVVRANDGGSGTPGVILRTDNGANDIVRFQDGTTIVAVVKNDGSIFVGSSTGVTLNSLTNRLSVSSTTYNLFDISRFSDNAIGPNFYLVKSRNGSIGGNTIVANDDNLGNITWVGANGTGFTDAAAIKAEVDGIPGASNDMPGRLVFSTTADGAGSSTERMRITSDAYLRMAASTGGIQFNGDTAAANALDDYEQGTFTPTVEGDITSGTGTYSRQTGTYTKIGNLVTVNVWLDWIAHTGTGNLLFADLPFTSIGTTDYRASGTFGWVYNLALSANNVITVAMSPSTTKLGVGQYPVGGGVATQVPIDTSANVHFAITYQTV